MFNTYADFPYQKASTSSRRNRSSIYGVGTNDANYVTSPMFNGRQVRCPIFLLWYKMMEDCYSPLNKEKRAQDIQHRVCPEWKSFNNFRNWVLTHNESQWLNKQLKLTGTYYYSKRSVEFVSTRKKRAKSSTPKVTVPKSLTLKDILNQADKAVQEKLTISLNNIDETEVTDINRYVEVKLHIHKALKVLK